MGKKDIFRTAVIGGYQKDDVMDYVRSLENEKETIRVLTRKESNGVKAQLEREKAASEEMRKRIAAMQEKITYLEEEKKNWQENPEQIREETNDYARLELQKLMEEMKRSNERLEKRCQQLERCIMAVSSSGTVLGETEEQAEEGYKMEQEKENAAQVPKVEIESSEMKEIKTVPDDALPKKENETAGQTPQESMVSDSGQQAILVSNGTEQADEEATKEKVDSGTESTASDSLPLSECMQEELSSYEKKARQSLNGTREKIASLLKTLEDRQEFF